MLFYYIIINLLYFCSFIFIGEKICKTLHIENSLQSTSKKNYSNNATHIIVDDGSKDKTFICMRSYEKNTKSLLNIFKKLMQIRLW